MRISSFHPTFVLAFSILSPWHSAFSQCCGGASAFGTAGGNSGSSVATDFGPRERLLVDFLGSAPASYTYGDNTWPVNNLPAGQSGGVPTQHLVPQAPSLSQGTAGVPVQSSLTSGTAKSSTESSTDKADPDCPKVYSTAQSPPLPPPSPPYPRAPLNPNSQTTSQTTVIDGRPAATYRSNAGAAGTAYPTVFRDSREQGKLAVSITGGRLININGTITEQPAIVNIETTLGRDSLGYGSSGVIDVNPFAAGQPDLTALATYRIRSDAQVIMGGPGYNSKLVQAPEGVVSITPYIPGSTAVATLTIAASTSGRSAVIQPLPGSSAPATMYTLGHSVVETSTGQPTKTTLIWRGQDANGTTNSTYGMVKTSWGGTDAIEETFVSSHDEGATFRTIKTTKSYISGAITTTLEEKTDHVSLFSWGEQSTSTKITTEALGGLGIETQYAYWDPQANGVPDTTDPNYGTLKLQVNPDGSWATYYQENVTQSIDGAPVPIKRSCTIRPWKNTAPPAASDALEVLKALTNVVVTQTDRGTKADGTLFTFVTTSVNGIITQHSETTLVRTAATISGNVTTPATSLRTTKSFFGSGASDFFATVSALDDQDRPTDVYRLKKGATDPILANRISRTHYVYNSGGSAAAFPFYTDSGTFNFAHSCDVTTVETEADLPFHFKSVTAVERATRRTIVEDRSITNDGGTTWLPIENRKHEFDTRGRPTTTTLNGTIVEESFTYPSTYVMTRTDAEGMTTTTYDAFGRVLSHNEDTLTLGAFWVPQRVTTNTYAQRLANAVPVLGYKVTTTVAAYNNGAVGPSSQPISSWSANNVGSSYPSGNWSRSSIAQIDGAGRSIYAMDSLGVVTTTAYDGTITTLSYPAATPAVVPVVTTMFLDGRISSQIGDTVLTRSYDYPLPTTAYETLETSVTAAGGSLATTTTKRDGLGRIRSVQNPTSATSPTTPVLKVTEYTYDDEGKIQAIRRPGTGAGTTYCEVYAYEQSPQVTKSALGTDALWDSGDANQHIETVTYVQHDGLWWQQTKIGPSPLGGTPGDFTSMTETALGPWAYEGSRWLAGWTITYLPDGATQKAVSARKTYLTPTGRKREVLTYLNGALQSTQTYLNGVAYKFENPNIGSNTFTISPLREWLVEPSSSTLFWPRVGRTPTTGQVVIKALPVATGNSYGDTLETYTYWPASSGPKAGLLSTKAIQQVLSPAVITSGTTRYDYNARGQLTNQWGGGTYPVAYTYDNEGRMTTLSTYRAGSFTAVVWPGGTADTTIWTYAPGFAQPLQKTYPPDPVSNPLDKKLVYTYYDNGSLATRVWQRGLTTTYSYDNVGRLHEISYSDGVTAGVNFAYLSTGHLFQRSDGTGITTYTYTADGRVAKESTMGGLNGARVVERLLDSDLRLGTLQANWEAASMPTLTYGYDSAQRLTQVTGGGRQVTMDAFNVNGYPVTTTYKIADAGGSTYSPYLTRSTALDTEGRVGNILYTVPGTSTLLQSFGYVYDRYAVKSTTRENLNQWIYSYDEKMQVKQAKKLPTDAGYMGMYATALKGQDTTYNYDQIGNRTSVVENTYPAKTLSYTPNAVNQNSAVNNTGGKFDVSGYRSSGTANILIYQNNGSGQTPDYQNAGSAFHYWKRLTHSGTPPWDRIDVSENGAPIEGGYQFVPPATNIPTYDEDGNLKTDARYTYTWDGENRLVSLTWTAAQSPDNHAGSITYTYDGLSRRIGRKSTFIDSNNTTQIVDYTGYLYDGWNHIQTVRFNTNESVRGQVAAYVWGPDIGSRHTAHANWQAAGGVGGLLMVLDGASTAPYGTSPPTDPNDDDYFPLMDRLGNVTAYKKASTSTPATQLDAIYEYDAFGQEIRSTGPAADKLPYHFSTKFTDEQTGLNYYGFRWYDAGNGRWLGRDPIGEAGGVNLFTALVNNSLRYIDSDGRAVVDVGGGIAPNLSPPAFPSTRPLRPRSINRIVTRSEIWNALPTPEQDYSDDPAPNLDQYPKSSTEDIKRSADRNCNSYAACNQERYPGQDVDPLPRHFSCSHLINRYKSYYHAEEPKASLQESSCTECPPGYYKITIWRSTGGSNFHVARQANDGGWYHKEGTLPAQSKPYGGDDYVDPTNPGLTYEKCATLCLKIH